jgi:hypothetical protein
MTIALNQVKDELDDHVVFAAQDFCDSVGDPSVPLLLATKALSYPCQLAILTSS